MKTKEEIKIMNSERGWDFKAETEQVSPEDALYHKQFGFAGRQPFDWRPYLPVFEDQRRSVYCLIFSLLNGIETMLIKKMADKGEDINKLKEAVNFAERWLVAHINFSDNGTSFKMAMDTARDYDLVKDADCPFKPEWLENPNAYAKQIKDISEVQEKISKGEVKTFKAPNYSRVNSSLSGLKDALADTPLWAGVGVGWNWEDSVVKRPSSYVAYHGIILAHIDSNYKYIMDNLGRPLKKLSLDYPILYAYSYRNLPTDWKSFNSMLERLLLNGVEQYIVSSDNKKVSHIPDEETLKYILEMGIASETETNVSTLESYEKTKPFPSVSIMEGAKDFKPKLDDAFSDKELAQGNTLSLWAFKFMRKLKEWRK